MPSMFNARDAGNYEKLMGRWSRRLAPLFIEHAGIADGEEVLEIGCGTGSLTFTLPQKAALAKLTAIDHSEIYLAAAQARNHDPHIRLEHGDGHRDVAMRPRSGCRSSPTTAVPSRPSRTSVRAGRR